MSSAAAEVSLFKTKLNSSRCNSKALSPPLLLCRAQELLGGPVGSPSDQLRGTCRRAAKDDPYGARRSKVFQANQGAGYAMSHVT